MGLGLPAVGEIYFFLPVFTVWVMVVLGLRSTVFLVTNFPVFALLLTFLVPIGQHPPSSRWRGTPNPKMCLVASHGNTKYGMKRTYVRPALTPMTRPGAKETMSPSRNTSADACPTRASLVGVEDLEHGSPMHATLLIEKPSDDTT